MNKPLGDTLLAGLLGVTLLLVDATIAHAGTVPYDGVTCSYATTQDVNLHLGSVTVYADTFLDGDRGGFNGNTPAAAGVCVDGLGLPAEGAIEAGATAPILGQPANGPNRLCVPHPIPNPVASPAGSNNINVPNGGIGAYVIADGHNNGTIAQTAGYVGFSNYETAQGTGTNQYSPTLLVANDPPNPNGGGSSNSGGCAGISTDPVTGAPVGVYAPVPLIACGNDTGRTWWNTAPGSGPSRDGCFID
jgi:hypothetical protein